MPKVTTMWASVRRRLASSRRRKARQFGIDEGVYSVPEDFYAALPDDLLADFYH